MIPLKVRFASFYLLCGSGAALTQTLTNPVFRIPVVGASGAVSSILGASLLLFPHARVLTFNFDGGGVAWFAYIGGFAGGMVPIGVFKNRNVPWGWQRQRWHV